MSRVEKILYIISLVCLCWLFASAVDVALHNLTTHNYAFWNILNIWYNSR